MIKLTQEQKKYKFTNLQLQQIKTLVDDWNAKCKGNYSSSFVGGVAHGYLDSGILTDGLSERDMDLLAKYFTDEAIYTSVELATLNDWLRQLEEDNTLKLDCLAFKEELDKLLTDEQRLIDKKNELKGGHERLCSDVALDWCWKLSDVK